MNRFTLFVRTMAPGWFAAVMGTAPEFDSIRDELSLQFLGNLGIHRLFLLNLV